MKTLIFFFSMTLIFLFAPGKSNAQDSLRLYLNGGYITNFKKSVDSSQPDTGGSIRIGLLTKGRMGYYTGLLWFKEFNLAGIGYDDRGIAFLAGIDYLFLKSGNLYWYIQAGLEAEKFISDYPTYSESETNIKPDIGLLLNYKFINFFIGFQPSDQTHINMGVGFTVPLRKQ